MLRLLLADADLIADAGIWGHLHLCVHPTRAAQTSCRVSRLSSQPVLGWLTTLSADALQLILSGMRLKRLGSVEALLHPAGCLAVIVVMKLSACHCDLTHAGQRAQGGGAGLPLGCILWQGRCVWSMRLNKGLAACAAAESRNNVTAGSTALLVEYGP